jgi:Transposase DDE domain
LYGRNRLKIDKKLLIQQHRKDISFLITNSLSEQAIDCVARETKFMIRKGKVPPSCFVDTLLFNENDQADISLPDLTCDLNQVYGIDVSKEAMHKKFTSEAVNFLKGLLGELLGGQLKELSKGVLPLYFPRIKIKDSTKFSLPDSYGNDYKGYGNFSKNNGLVSIQYEYDLVSGDWLSIDLTKGLRNDQQDSKETVDAITQADLHIRDLGYITPTYLSAVVDKQAFFLNRLPPNAGVFTMAMKTFDWKKTDASFRKNSLLSLEAAVIVYEKNKIPCRLIIEKVSKAEYERRLEKARKSAKSRGVGISDLYKIKLRYNTFITNVSASILPVAIVRKTYYLRWQIELVFKTWKSFFNIDKIKKVKKERVECQLIAKLLWILINWRLFRTCNNHTRKIDKEQGISVIIFFKRCTKFTSTLRLVLLKRLSIIKWLEQIYLPLIADCACEAPRNKQTHYQTLKMNIIPLS